VVTKIAAELDGFRFDIQRVLACGDVAVSQLRCAGTVNRARNFADAYRISTVTLCQRTGSGPGLIGRDFPANAVNRKWYGDGTEIETDEGKLYLASVLDMGSRRVVGFALSEHHDAELAQAALAMAVAVRGGKEAIAGVIMHTD
jgi:transposase InsO family protein